MADQAFPSRELPIESLGIGDETEFGVIDEHDVYENSVWVKFYDGMCLGFGWRLFNKGDKIEVFYR